MPGIGRKLEICCGTNPSAKPGYESNDINPGVGIEHVGAIQDMDFDDGTFVEIFGTGAIEHLTYEEAARFLRRAIRWLTPGGVLYLDAPDMLGWVEDLIRQRRSKSSVITALNGWRRFSGDEHKSFWTLELLTLALRVVGFDPIDAHRKTDRDKGANESDGTGPSDSDWHVCVRAYRQFGDLPVVIAPDAVSYGW